MSNQQNCTQCAGQTIIIRNAIVFLCVCARTNIAGCIVAGKRTSNRMASPQITVENLFWKNMNPILNLWGCNLASNVTFICMKIGVSISDALIHTNIDMRNGNVLKKCVVTIFKTWHTHRNRTLRFFRQNNGRCRTSTSMTVLLTYYWTDTCFIIKFQKNLSYYYFWMRCRTCCLCAWSCWLELRRVHETHIDFESTCRRRRCRSVLFPHFRLALSPFALALIKEVQPQKRFCVRDCATR